MSDTVVTRLRPGFLRRSKPAQGEANEADSAQPAFRDQTDPPANAPADLRAVAIRGQERVIAHYRKLLAHPKLQEAERVDFEDRLAKAEVELAAFAA